MGLMITELTLKIWGSQVFWRSSGTGMFGLLTLQDAKLAGKVLKLFGLEMLA